MDTALTLNTDMVLVLGVLVMAAVLFITEAVRVDVAALAVLVTLGLLGLVPGDRLFDGFASNAVISIIAVMILGAGLDRTGALNQVAAGIVRVGGRSERRIMAMVSGSVGVISAFMQNVGAAALYIPLVGRISARTSIPQSRLLLPMGYCAILGGTLTLVGSSPLILLNDLLDNANRSLPPGAGALEKFELFDVTPIGLALLAAGIAYFLVTARFLLPAVKVASGKARRPKTYFADVYGIEGDLHELLVTMDSPLVGMRVGEAENLPGAPFILAIQSTEEPRLAPPADEMIWVGTMLGVMGRREEVERFAEENALRIQPRLRTFSPLFNAALAGITEVVIPPASRLIGNTVGESRLRSRFGISVLAINRRGQIVTEDIRSQTLEPGDCLVSHSSWKDLAALARERDFLVASDLPQEEARPQKVSWALLFFAVSLSLVLFSEFRLSLSLLVGALGMVLTGVLSMDEAYRAVSWKTIFLLACLIPLGSAMESTATAAWLAQGLIGMLGDVPPLVLQAVLAALATLFSLMMSNVGATVLLVPIAINVALATGSSPAGMALIVALATSNAFLLPTHQVNALTMGPGGYRVADFIRAGSGLSVVFIAVLLVMVNLLY